MKQKLIPILPVILFLALILFFFPRFYFNQLEDKERQIYSSIEETRQSVNKDIEQRSGREGGIKSFEEFKSLSVDITAGLNKIGTLADEHEAVLNKQAKIAFLLPSKYKKFLSLNQEGFDKYYSAQTKFKYLKEYESGTIELTYLRDQLGKLMSSSAGSVSENLIEIKKLITELEDNKIKIKKYFDEGFMTEEYYNATLESVNADIELHRLFIEAYENNYSPEELEKRIKEVNDKYKQKDLLSLFRDSFNKITTVKQEEWAGLDEQAGKLTGEAYEYYDNNRLAFDPLSVLLSKVNKNFPKNTSKNNYKNKGFEDTKADLDGDGERDILRLIFPDEEQEFNEKVSLVAYDKNGNEIGRLPEEMPINQPLSDSAIVYTPVKKEKNQFVSYEFAVGPHSSETMFFGLFDLEAGGKGILPVCLTPDVKSAYDCIFWSGEIGSLVADDFDEDGFIEVVEMVDEYPEEGATTSEVEDIINKEFKEEKAAEGMINIVKREQGGRGNRVVWGISRYNGEFFEEQLNADYEKYFKLIDLHIRHFYPNYPTIMRKSGMSKDSLEYNVFMKNFWTHAEEQ